MISRVASFTSSSRPAGDDRRRSRPKTIGAYASTPVLSSTWGASLLAPAATGAGLRLLSEDASPPNFPARLGLHRQGAGLTVANSTPQSYERWLRRTIEVSRLRPFRGE